MGREFLYREQQIMIPTHCCANLHSSSDIKSVGQPHTKYKIYNTISTLWQDTFDPAQVGKNMALVAAVPIVCCCAMWAPIHIHSDT